MKREFRIGTLNTGYKRRAVVTVEAEIEAGGRLSISATAKRPGASDIDQGGQMYDSLLSQDFLPAYGWNADRVRELVAVWQRWHLNDMRAGCEHQRTTKWDSLPIDPSKPLNTYGKHFEGQRSDSWNMLTWVRPDEHPEGLLTKPCPVCGYKYGSAWQSEPLPPDIITYVENLPNG
jgi:hypothetical protein